MRDGLSMALQDLGSDYGCPPGVSIIDFLRVRLSQARALEPLQELFEAASDWSTADHTPPDEARTDAQVEEAQRAADLRLLGAVDRARAALEVADG